jgi:iron complex outermembrane receptor protein
MYAQTSISGTVLDAENQENLVGANIRVLNTFQATSSDQNGEFQLNRLKEDAQLKISFIGYESDTLDISEADKGMLKISLQPKAYQTEEVIISSTRLDENAPGTVTNVSKEEIEKNNLGQDLPYLLQQTPSLVTTSDAGAGVGYTGLRIRGSDASRINVTVNGIPLNDAESHGVFWVNMPDLASSMESIQIQRGVGTSTNGAAAFGASMNLQTTGMNEKAYGEVDNSFGSFNTRKHTVKLGSGLINNKYVFEGRLSRINSDGYIDRASSDLKSYYLSGAHYGEKTVIKAITFGGKERTYQSWYGTPESRFNDDLEGMKTHAMNEGYSAERTESLLTSGRSYNHYMYENQVDNYNQDHYQLHFSHEFSKKVTGNLSFHYTKGAGYYEQFRPDEDLNDYGYAWDTLFIQQDNVQDTVTTTDLIRRRWLDNDFYGFTYSLLYQANSKLNFNLGGGLNQYIGDHFGEIIWSEYAENSTPSDRYYFNTGEKIDGNAYLKTTYDANSKLKLFADLQIRSISYKVKGLDNDQRELDVDDDFLFFNPKLGANYQINSNSSLYLLTAIGIREPNRADFTDLPPNTPKSEASKSEQMYNLETGYELRQRRFQAAANLFAMLYQDQLVNTGQLNDVGSPIRQNVDESYRAGIELQLSVKPTDKLKVSINATYSKNEIMDFTEYIYDYTNGYNILEIDQGTTDIAFSPEIIVNGEINYQLFKGFEIAILSRYIGEQYLDNTSNEDRKLDAYFVNDVRLSYQIPTKLIKEASIRLLVNNVFSTDYASNGYTYSYIYGETITENFVYPQAFRNYLVSLNLKF